MGQSFKAIGQLHNDAAPAKVTPGLQRRFTLPRLLLALAVLLYAGYFSYLTLVRYAAFEARAFDMGNLDQAIWNTAHGQWFHLTNEPGTVNRLSLHVEPILIPISWLYWIYSGPPILLILQACVVALGAWPLFALARFKLKSEWLALLFSFVFLLNPSIQAANWLEFHPLTLAPTLLMAAFFFLVTDRPGWFAFFALLAASCKEEMALLVFMMGLYAFFVLRRRKLGLLTMVLSLSWALLAVLVIQNTFADGNIHWGRYSYLGATPLQKVITLVSRPAIVLAQLRAANALQYLGWLLLPIGFVALCAPEILLLALPSLAINLLADFSPMHQVNELIYAAPIVPFVLIGGIYGVAHIASYGLHHWDIRHTRTVYPLLGTVIISGALFAQHQFGYLPDSGNARPFTVTEHHRRAAAIIAQIPPDAKVSAQDRLNPHVSGRQTLYIFPRLDDADTVFLDVTNSAWPQHPNDLRKTVDDLLATGWGVAAADDGYLLLRKGDFPKAWPPTFDTAWRKAKPALVNSHQIDFADTLRLLDYQVETDSHGELVTQLYWTALKPLDHDLRFYIAYLDPEGKNLQDSQFYPPVASLWYPTSKWPLGATVLVQTLPWTLTTDRFTLAVGLYEGENGWQNGQRLPVTKVEPALPLLENRTIARLGGYVQTTQKQWQALPPVSAPPAQALDAKFGEQLVLQGVTVPELKVKAGNKVVFNLYWQALQPPDFDYAIFAHLLDASGNKVAQLDGQPHDGSGLLPFTAWTPGQSVVESEQLSLPKTVVAGEYQLIVGLYNWQDGKRLPVTGANAQAGDVVTVAQIQVK
ncbi:MAG: DUF2079 domain-containing protein [Chloroflexi bacterium]|nr:DUF2079 domain-containing protein [Chloroflexota bacterium]